jgi:hypothetical protein
MFLTSLDQIKAVGQAAKAGDDLGKVPPEPACAAQKEQLLQTPNLIRDGPCVKPGT